MSKILRRPMFRGGPVSSYGTGIASGLGYNEGGRVGYEQGGDVGFFKSIYNAINPTSGEIVERMQEAQSAPSLAETLMKPAPLEFRTQEEANIYITANPDYKGKIKVRETGEIVDLSEIVTPPPTTPPLGETPPPDGPAPVVKSDKEVIQEYMDMFKENLGGDKEELKRAKYLELAKFGANLLAQPGGQTLGESIGKAGAPALEGISALQATERAGDRQAKALGFQAALKELEPGSLEKNAKALAKLTGGTVSEAAKQLSTNASASNNKLNTIKILMESITAEPGIQYAVSEIMYDNGISRKDVSKIKDPNKITGDEVVGRYYYFEKPGSKGEVMGRWDGKQFILPGESGFK